MAKTSSTTKQQSTGGSSSSTRGGSTSSSVGGSSSRSVGGSSSATRGGSESASSSQSLSSGQSGSVSNSTSIGSSDTTSHSVGGSHSTTYGTSVSDSTTQSQQRSQGGSNTQQAGKSWASGQVDAETQRQRAAHQTYVEDPKVQQTYERLQNTINSRPGAFSSTWDSTLGDLYNQIVGGDRFSYDFNKDALYRMYAQQYQNQGRTAMRDTMGQAAALTGGYGSSYAQSVGNQQYQNYLQRLNDIIPELQQQAYQRYQQGRADLRDQFSMASQLRNNDYQAYRDTVSDWQSDRGFDQSAYQDMRNYDRSAFEGDRNYWQQEYWNQRNAEQSNLSNANSSNWSDTIGTSQTHGTTQSQSTTDSTNWSDTTSHTDSRQNTTTNQTGWNIGQQATVGNTASTNWSNTESSNWQNTDTSNWQNTNSSSWSDTKGSNWSNSTSTSSGDDGRTTPGSGWVQANDTAVALGTGANATQTQVRNSLERQLSNAGDNPDRQDAMLARWMQQGLISEEDAEYMMAKLINTKGYTTNGR